MAQEGTDVVVDIKQKVLQVRLWRVVFHNDNYTPMEFVVNVLIEIFGKTADESTELMLTIHHKGQAQIGLFTKEIAMQKVAEVTRVATAFGHPLLATAEEA